MSDTRRSNGSSDTRATIVDVAARLLHEEGPAALTTRGVAQAAGVQAPTIYRLFGDKDGLLEAVAEHVMATYVSAKAAHVATASADDVDPLDDLRDGWRNQIDFGVANPAIFRLLSDPLRVRDSAAARSGKRVLEARIRRVARTGRLRVGETRAVDLVQAAGTGAIQTLLATPVADRDPGLPDAIYEAVLQQILVPSEGTTAVAQTALDAAAGAAVTLRAGADQLEMLSASERRLLAEWLDRVIAAR